jgi:hypothetical protein
MNPEIWVSQPGASSIQVGESGKPGEQVAGVS